MNKRVKFFEEGIEEIKKEEFRNNNDYSSFIFPSSLIIIKEGAFRDISSVKVYDLQSDLFIIEAFAFYGDDAVIFVPEGVKDVGYNAFGKNAVVFFEGRSDNFYGFEDEKNGEILRFYEEGATIYYEKSHDDFLKYLKENNIY